MNISQGSHGKEYCLNSSQPGNSRSPSLGLNKPYLVVKNKKQKHQKTMTWVKAILYFLYPSFKKKAREEETKSQVI